MIEQCCMFVRMGLECHSNWVSCRFCKGCATIGCGWHGVYMQGCAMDMKSTCGCSGPIALRSLERRGAWHRAPVRSCRSSMDVFRSPRSHRTVEYLRATYSPLRCGALSWETCMSQHWCMIVTVRCEWHWSQVRQWSFQLEAAGKRRHRRTRSGAVRGASDAGVHPQDTGRPGDPPPVG